MPRLYIVVLPYMASLVAKKKGNKLYYYVVESARVDGQPRIVHQSYLGSAEKVAALVRDRTAPIPLSATMRDFGLPGALWLAAQQTGVFELLQQLWPQPRSGPSTAHYLLLAAIHRICQPGLPQIPFARNPPSTAIVCPVTNEAASLARKIAHPTSSPTLPTRPIGVRPIIEEMRVGISSALAFSGVRNTPGAIAFTRTPCVAHSQARLLVSMCTPALLAA